MLTGSYKSRERRLEHKLSEAEVMSARARRDRFVIACQQHGIPLSVPLLHRAYIEALEEQARGEDYEGIPDNPFRYERRDYSKRWLDMDWPT